MWLIFYIKYCVENYFCGHILTTWFCLLLCRKGSTFAMWATRPTTTTTMISFILLIVAAFSEGKLKTIFLFFCAERFIHEIICSAQFVHDIQHYKKEKEEIKKYTVKCLKAKCLKAKCLKSELVRNLNFFLCLFFLHISKVSEIQPKKFD